MRGDVSALCAGLRPRTLVDRAAVSIVMGLIANVPMLPRHQMETAARSFGRRGQETRAERVRRPAPRAGGIARECVAKAR
jgi:hypothetical protein